MTPTPTAVGDTCGEVCDNRACGSFTCPGGQPQTRFCSVSGPGGHCQCSPVECPTPPDTLTATAITTPTALPTCVPTLGAETYCTDHCPPCPTIRAGCPSEACRDCRENPVCGPGEICVPWIPAQGECCSCAAQTPPAPPTSTPLPASCIGDCNGDGVVRINELISGVNIVLNGAQVGACPALDCEGSLSVSINCLIAAVGNALNGCRRSTPSPLATPIPTVDTFLFCAEREWVGGCCDFAGHRPCYRLMYGSHAAQCIHTDGGYPRGCAEYPVRCNESTGLCE